MYRNHVLAAAFVLAGLSGCASAPPVNPSLESARTEYRIAAGDERVRALAPLELDRASQMLNRAEVAWADDRDEGETAHLAYLARQQAALAQRVAQRRIAEEQIARAGEERDRLRLQARTAEAERARAAAESARGAAEQARAQATTEADRAARLKAELAALQARQTERGMVVTLPDVLFDTGRAELKPGAYRTVDRLAAFLQEYPQRRVRVEGFTDSTGSAEANLALSERRATAVRDALLARGVPANRVEVRPYGEDYPVATNDTAAGRQMNRRVEVLLSDDRGALDAAR